MKKFFENTPSNQPATGPPELFEPFSPPRSDRYSDIRPDDGQPPDERFWNWPLIALSWLVLFGVCGFMFAAANLLEKPGIKEREASRSDLIQVNLMGRYAVGAREIAPASVEQLEQSIENLDFGPLEQRFCCAVLIAELSGSEAAHNYLQGINQLRQELEFVPTQQQQQIESLLLAAYQGEQLGTAAIEPDQQQLLAERLGWCGRLASTHFNDPPAQLRESLIRQAKTTTIGLILLGIGGMVIGLAGLVASIIFAILVFSGQLRSSFQADRKYGGVYVEAVAVWAVLFVGVSIFSGLAVVKLGVPEVVLSIGFVLTLVALAWPLARGVSLDALLDDIGWRLGNPLKEIACAAVAYLATLPVLAVALVLVTLLLALFGAPATEHELMPPNNPSHPIQEQILTSESWLPLVSILVMACVIAPIVEETVFRGLLYRHLRELSCRCRVWVSIACAVVVNSLLFAAIHPQGLAAVPLLATLAASFSLVREWRGSLLAPMVMHAINNFVITCLMLFLM